MRHYKFSLTAIALLAVLSLLASACSSKPVQTALASEAAPKGAVRPASAKSETTRAMEEAVPQSVFTVDQNSRDPFFPKARAKMETESDEPQIALDVPALLQSSLYGIISSGGKSIAYVGDVMLESGRSAAIPIRAAGQERHVTVRCVEVTKDTVVLEVQGYTEPVRLTKVTR